MKKTKKEIGIQNYIGAYLKRELKARNLTQEEFAERIGYSDRTVRRWVSGDIHKFEHFEDIAAGLGVTVWDIILDEDDVSFLFLNRTDPDLQIFFKRL